MKKTNVTADIYPHLHALFIAVDDDNGLTPQTTYVVPEPWQYYPAFAELVLDACTADERACLVGEDQVQKGLVIADPNCIVPLRLIAAYLNAWTDSIPEVIAGLWEFEPKDNFESYPGWSFVDDDGSEWSLDHPISSGQNGYAEDVRPCTLLDFVGG